MIEAFTSADLAAAAAAGAIVAKLTAPGPRHLLVTGGSSPGPVYDQLAEADLDWSRVTVTLSDERFVEPTSALSNEKLVRERLLVGKAAAARFVPLRRGGSGPRVDAADAETEIRALLPFHAALLGMGEDGHIASLFPDAPGLAAALDPNGQQLVVGVAQAGLEPYVPRISLTAAALFDTELALLLIKGEPKRALVERVASDPDYAPPVAALLRQTHAPVRVLWSP